MFYDDKTDYMDLLPERWQNYIEINAIAGCINIQFDKLAARIKQSTDNKSVTHADELGVARWEKILGVTAPLNSTLQARRDALRAKLMSKPPINLQTLKGVIEAYMGLPVDIELAPDYLIKVWYRGESRIADIKPLYATIYDTIPANLIVQIMYRWLTLGELTAQNLTLGTLTAKNLTFKELGKGDWIG